MRRDPPNSGSRREQGIITTLVAIFMLFVVGAMAALSIDVVTFYTARSEAQIAADGAALAAARVLANSGMTSSTDPTLAANAESLAVQVGSLVAQQNQVGGRTLAASEVTVNPPASCSIALPPYANLCVTVRVQRVDLPTFFARIWGTNTVTVGASATAEAYNPSGLASVSSGSGVAPVALSCVKPWLLPNIDPIIGSPATIFVAGSGAISDSALLGWESTSVPGSSIRLHASVSSSPAVWQYYQQDETGFPPIQDVPACATAWSSRQQSIAGCVPTPVACGSFVNILTASDPTLDPEAAAAVDCLTNSSSNGGDKAQTIPPAPFEFIAGDDNPLVASGALTSPANVMVSNSLVTVPVFDNSTWTIATPPTSVQVIGFVQLFLQPSGNRVPRSGMYLDQIRTKVINMVGCGTNAANSTAVPVYGNGPSAVPVRLITPP